MAQMYLITFGISGICFGLHNNFTSFGEYNVTYAWFQIYKKLFFILFYFSVAYRFKNHNEYYISPKIKSK